MVRASSEAVIVYSLCCCFTASAPISGVAVWRYGRNYMDAAVIELSTEKSHLSLHTQLLRSFPTLSPISLVVACHRVAYQKEPGSISTNCGSIADVAGASGHLHSARLRDPGSPRHVVNLMVPAATPGRRVQPL